MTLNLKPARSKYHDNKRYQLWPTYLHDTYCIAPSFNVYIPSYNGLYILKIIRLSIHSYSVYTSVTSYSNSDLKITIIVIVLTPHPTAQPAPDHSPGCHRASSHCYNILKKRCPHCIFLETFFAYLNVSHVLKVLDHERGRCLPRIFHILRLLFLFLIVTVISIYNIPRSSSSPLWIPSAASESRTQLEIRPIATSGL